MYDTKAGTSCGSKGDVYILPEGTSLPAAGKTINIAEIEAAGGIKIASVDYSPKNSSGAGVVKIPVVAENVKLKKGNNILLFVVTDKGENANSGGNTDYYTYPTSLTLTPMSEVPPTNPAGVTSTFDFKSNKTLTAGEEKLIASGESAEVAFPASDTDGWSAYCYSAGAEYFQSNDGINRTISQICGDALKLAINTVGDWVALKIPVPKRGIYDVSLSYKQFQNYASADVYMIKAPKEELSEAEKRAYVEGKLSTAFKYASIDCNAADKFITPVVVQYPAEFSFSAFEDNSEYLLVFKSTSSIPQKKKLLLDTLTLDGSGTKESSLSEFAYNFNTKSGIAGNSNPVEATYADTLSMWEGFASSGVKSAQAKTAMSNIALKAVGDFVAFKINLPASDTFVATVGYYKHASSGDDGDVYILPGTTKVDDVASSLTEDKKLTGLKYYIQDGETAGNYVTGKIEKTLPAGEYIVVFNVSAKADRNTGSGTAIYPGNITFKRKSSLPPYSLIAEKVMLVPGETTNLSLKDYDGNPIDEFEIREISSSDESIVTVDGTTVTAGEGFGRAKISATVLVSGEEVKAEGYVRVINKSASNLRVSASIDSRSDTWINPGYKRDNSLYPAESDAKLDIGGFDPGDGITEDFTDGWSWYGDSSGSHNHNTFYQVNKSYLRVRMSDGQWFAIKMNFENSGHYRAVVNHRATANNAYADMYFIPVPKEGEEVSDYLTDDYKLGEIMNYNPDVAKWNAPGAEISSYVGDAYVDAPGQYLAVIKMTGRKATGGNQYLYFNDLIFTGANPITEVSGAAGISLMPGDTVALDKSLLTLEDEIAEYRERASLSFESLTPDIVSVNAEGVVTGITYGVGKIKVTASYEGYSRSGEYLVYVGSGKERRSFYTDEKVENARKNIERYDWAKDEAEGYIKEADKLLSVGADTLYELITTQELLRASTVGYRFRDTGMYQCLYCDKDLSAQYSQYPWIMDPYTRPWKLQCPDCKRLFPSNDFEKFYKLGLDENGNWRYMDALQRHHEMFVCPTYNSTGECNCSRPAGTIESWIADLEARTAALSETLVYPEPSAGERGSEEWNSYYGYGVKGGYLYNDTYGEKNDAFFAVDDGFGYEQVYQLKNEDGSLAYNDNGTPKVERRSKPFIGYYNSWGLWEGAIPKAIENLAMAYLYTDDIKYGRLGAIMIDRIADVYLEMDNTLYGSIFQTNDGNTKTVTGGVSKGRVVGALHDCNVGLTIVPAYDALWPAYEDEWVIDYLSEKAEEMKLSNSKKNAVEIRTNIENNYLREINVGIRDYRISANFGVPQRLHIMAAVVLDALPETQEWVEFAFKSGGRVGYYLVTGGNVYAQLMNVISRDGHGSEAAPSYNSGWIGNMLLIGEALHGYDKVEGYDLYNNPKMKRMLTSQIDLICASIWSPNVGDSAQMGKRYMAPTVDALRIAFDIIEDEEIRENIVKAYYLQMRGLDKLHGSIFDEDPEAITRFAKKVTDESVEISLPSRNLTGYGMAILRDGEWIDSTNSQKNINTQRDFYMWYGMAKSHDHSDKLSIGFHAFGLDIGADIGTPRLKSSGDPHRNEFVGHTLPHNTVMVDNVRQTARTTKTNPLHFDSASRVQLMEVEAPWVYSGQGVEEYQRTLVMVDVDDDISYGVDFFRILGGNDHLYSFHTLSKEAVLSENVVIKKQTDENGKYIGSYQGVDKAWGGSYIDSGDEEGEDGLSTESWFGEVDRAENASEIESFSIDWKILDNYKVLSPAKNNLHVRLTMLPSFKLDEITTTSGIPPQLKGAMDKVRFLFARHTGAADGTKENGKLATLFTSVIEPYDTTRYVDSIENVKVIRADGAEFTLDEAKAVKVTLTNGREDYIVYAKDNTIPYKVLISDTESFDFCGFVGVVSIKDEKIIYTYINDGSAVADKENLLPAYTGNVVDFERDLSEKNHIDVALNEECEDASVFENKYIYVENNLSDNGSYRIESAEKIA
ncbi:MAG: heparinase II/III family protein, partial [Oscillospiraceae bacterium]|nr:heparinase II/III family protein [Oscillospiraceae bacterium]